MSDQDGGGTGPTILRALFRKLEEIQADQRKTDRLLMAQMEQGRRFETQLIEIRQQLAEQGQRFDRQQAELHDALAEQGQRSDRQQAELRDALTGQGRRSDRQQAELRDEIVKQGQRYEKRADDLRDEVDLMIKAELMGQLGMLRTELGHRFDEVAERLTVLEGGDPWRAESGPS